MRVILFAVSPVLFVSLAFAQVTEERVLQLTHAESIPAINEAATVIRSISDIRQLSVDPVQKTLAMSASAEQVALAEWVFRELDQPANSGPAVEQRTYRVSDDDLARVFRLSHAGTVAELNEMAVVVRTLTQTPKMFVYTASRAIAIRGTADQLALTDWLIADLDVAGHSPSASAHEYRLPRGAEDVVRVFYLAHADSVQRLADIGTQVRALASIRKLMTYSGARAIAVRATAEQVAQADRLIKDLDR